MTCGSTDCLTPLECDHPATAEVVPDSAQGKGKLAVTAFGDLWLHGLACLVLFVTIGIGIWQLIDGAAVVSPLLISILWAAYASIPPFLLLLYSVTGHNWVMQFACKCAHLPA